MVIADVQPLSRSPRLDGLTGLRWWAAFLVFLYHVQVVAPIPGPLSAVLRQGYLGVTFFFVLSGFVLTWSFAPVLRRSTFYLRRFARIFPSHAVAWMLAVPVFYAVLPIAAPIWVRPVDGPVLLLSFVLLQGWFTVPAILFAGNPAAWTLTCEFFFYAIHPFAQRILRIMTVRATLLTALGVVAVAWAYRASAWAFDGSWWANLPLPIQRAPEFILGMCIAWAIRQGWRPRVPVAVGIVALAAVVLVIAVVPAWMPDQLPGIIVGRFGNEAFTVACALAIVAVAVSGLDGHRSVFGDRVQVRLGEWSFAFYLVHATVIYFVLWFIEPLAPSWWNVLPSAGLFLVGLLIAALLFHGVERPVERRIRRWKDARDRSLDLAAESPG